MQPAAAWVIAMLALPMAIVPARTAPVLAATLMANGAIPGPLPPVTLIQAALGAAVHAQPLGATTLKFALPPVE